MSRIRHLILRLWQLLRPNAADAELDREIRAHLGLLEDDFRRRGLPPDAARAAARRAFGGVERAKELQRDARSVQWLRELAVDLSHGLRALRRSPSFALTAILSLALGIGANAAIFNAAYSAFWKPLPVSRPEDIVSVQIWIDRAGTRKDVPPVELLRQLRSAEIFDGVSIISEDGLSLSYDDRAERVLGQVVSSNYFDLLGVRPTVGQPFTSSVRNGQWAPEAVLSYSFWQRRFGGDPGVIGRTIRLNTYPFIIVGVSPRGFFGLEWGTDADLRIPILPDGLELQQIGQISARPDRGLLTIARLKAGSSLARTESSGDAQLQEFVRGTTFPRYRTGGHLKLVPAGNGNYGRVDQFHSPLYVLFVFVALVLLIGCANVANMLLARAASRSRELAIRASIGAGRFRLIRQLLAESLLLSLLAGGLAIAIGHWASGGLVHFLPQGHNPVALDLRLDAYTVSFVLALSLITCGAFGVAPAMRATRGNLAVIVKRASGAAMGDASSSGFRKSLVVAQVALSLVLLIAAGVLVRTMLTLRPGDYRDPERVLLLTMKPQREIYAPEQRRLLVAELARRVSGIPGVEAAAVAEYGPLGSRTSRSSLEADGGRPVAADTDWVTSRFFDAVGMRRIAGRDFTPSDTVGSPLVVIINASMAQLLFADANPIGRSIRLAGDKDTRPFEIVGVVEDSRYYDVRQGPQPAAWFPFQDYVPYMPTLHVRTGRTDTGAIVAAVRQELDVFDTGFPVFDVKTLEVRIEESLTRERMLASLSGAIGVLALALAVVGIYGLLAYSVSRRTREIGIRMALGSSASSVLWMVAREALVLIAVGSLVGVVVATALWPILARMVPVVSPIDAPVLSVCAVVMLAIGTAAVIVPAIRACRIDPVTALRQE